MKRFRFKPDKAVGERLIKETRLAREKAEQLPPSMEREALLMKARAAPHRARPSPIRGRGNIWLRVSCWARGQSDRRAARPRRSRAYIAISRAPPSSRTATRPAVGTRRFF